MKITKKGLDKALHLGVAAWTAVSPLLVEQHVLSPLVSLDIGVAVATLLGGYHGGAAVQRRDTRPQVGSLR